MANSNNSKRPSRVIAAGRSEKKQKKIQDRLARQEQKMAEKLEREAHPEKSVSPKKRPVKSEATPTERSRSPKPDSTPKVKQKNRRVNTDAAKQTLSKVKNGFQVITGGRRKRFFRIGAVLAVLLTVIILINVMVPVSVGEYFENVFAGFGSGDGFPISVSTSEKSCLSKAGSDTALLGDSSLMLYKSNGKLLFERQHGFTNPAVATSTSRILLYDRGNSGVRIENRAKTILSLEAKGDIITANIAYNGAFAVATKGGNYVADVTVYDSDGLEQYTWHSATRHVTGVALSDNGRFLAVTTLHVEGGEAISGLLMFDTHENVTLSEQAYKGELALSVEFKDDVAVAVLQNRLVMADTEGGKKEHLFENGRLICFDNRNADGTVVVLEQFQNATQNQLLIFDHTLTLTGRRNIVVSGVSISADADSVALLLQDKVVFYDRQANPKSIVFLQADSTDLVCHGSCAIVMEHQRLVELKK